MRGGRLGAKTTAELAKNDWIVGRGLDVHSALRRPTGAKGIVAGPGAGIDEKK